MKKSNKRKVISEKKMKISTIIIAKNEENKIGDALRSLSWADEVIVVDTGSTDKTVDIAKNLGARVVYYSKGSYSDWRNFGLKVAMGDWILYLDADERVTPELKVEIFETISNFKFKIRRFVLMRYRGRMSFSAER
jgi:glycosyltransferase involved in cell wall biosynthesis